jgi:hypothetical protein
MRIRVEEAVSEQLVEHDGREHRGHVLRVDAGRAQAGGIRDLDRSDVFEGEHAAGGALPHPGGHAHPRVIGEGRAEALTDHDAVRHIAEFLKENNWPLEAKEDKVYGPHGPTAGPPPYTIFRIEPLKVFGLPGMTGMDQFDPSDLPKPTRWEFESVG